jgi:hypothetical protein
MTFSVPPIGDEELLPRLPRLSPSAGLDFPSRRIAQQAIRLLEKGGNKLREKPIPLPSSRQ